MRVLKFGGTSVGSPESIKQLIDIVLTEQKEENVAVVVSAFSGVTDQLIELCKTAAGEGDFAEVREQEILEGVKDRTYNIINNLIAEADQESVIQKTENIFEELEEKLEEIFRAKEYSLKDLDFVMSFGERFSAYIISEAFKNRGVDSEFLDARQLVGTDDSFGSAKVDFEVTNSNIKEYFEEREALQVITGFVGCTESGETTTLGRGGSDYTVSIFGAALDASMIEIWTDVDGVYTTDPRKVKQAFPIDKMTFEEAMEMSHFGAKVIYPPTMQPALQKQIPILIKNTFNPKAVGTVIGTEASEEDYAATGISSISNISLLQVQGSGMVGVAGVSSRLFGALAKNRISVILISQASSEHSICFAVVPEVAEQSKKILEEEFEVEIKSGKIDRVEIQEDLSIVALVGSGMKRRSGIAGKLFKSLGDSHINVVAIAQGSSELNISVVIDKTDEIKALEVVHQAFFNPDLKTVNVFLAGTGLIGGTLLDQIAEYRSDLIDKHNIEVNVVSIANVDGMILDAETADLENWRTELQEKGEENDMEEFVRNMKNQRLAHSVYVDCTATEKTISIFEEALESGISVVTPNKKANSIDSKTHKKLQKLGSKNGATFLYETNVGAALPVISTLKDLVITGDKIEKIEGVLSGTLSYIFNTFDEGVKFSEVVKLAQEKGYTEPDPREDLNGMDVMRKILILARETGLEIEPEDVEVENLIPESARNVDSVDEFFEALEKEDGHYNQKLEEAKSKGKVLRYIAKMEGDKVEVSLQAVGENHPFYKLSGTDNIVSFTTKRYNNTPLVIKGPGAGAEVTAAGVLADILRIAG